jgi:hypothetical protein
MYAISKENELSLIIEHKIFYYFIFYVNLYKKQIHENLKKFYKHPLNNV